MTAPLTPAPAQDTVQVDLSGRTALVTGAGSGIGRATALRLARAGAHVRALDITPEAVEGVAVLTGGTAEVVDLSDLGAVDRLDLTADIVVNCAGIQHVAPVHEFPTERFSQILRIMLEAPFRIIRGALPGMYARQWGRIVNVSSVHGLRASEFKSAYVSAKHGLEGLSKVVALESARVRRHVQLRQPGLRAHSAGGQADRRPGEGPRHQRGRGAQRGDARLGRAQAPRRAGGGRRDDRVPLQPAAASMTGTSLVVDGGWSAH